MSRILDLKTPNVESATPASGDLFDFYDISEVKGSPRKKATLGALFAALSEGSGGVVETASPTTGFSIAVDTSNDATYYLTPAGELASGTFSLPGSGTARAGQVVRLYCAETILSLTASITGGGTFLGPPPPIGADSVTSFAWVCLSDTGTILWLRIL